MKPKTFLLTCDFMIKLSQHRNPRGRGIIKAMASVRPVIAMEIWSGFVRKNETGFLRDAYRPKTAVSLLKNLAQNGTSGVTRLSAAARSCIAKFCGTERATKLPDICCVLAASGHP